MGILNRLDNPIHGDGLILGTVEIYQLGQSIRLVSAVWTCLLCYRIYGT